MGCACSTPWQRAAAARQYAAGQHADNCTPAAAAAPHDTAARHRGPCCAAEPPAADWLDPRDFTWQGLTGQTRVKLPGSVAGQQFIIDGCHGCDLWLLDRCASVTVDECTDCRVFVGPTEASVFLRSCTGCSVAAITRQMRCRDCANCTLLLCVCTRPIIEACSGMAFGCCDGPYAGLAAHMAAAQLSAFHNHWQEPFDFTPPSAGCSEGGSSSGGQPEHNWRLLPDGASVRQLLGTPELPQAVQPLMPAAAAQACACQQPQAGSSADEAAAGAAAAAGSSTASDTPAAALTPGDARAVIVTHPTRAAGADATALFVLFPPGCQAAAHAWVFEHLQQQRGEPDEQPPADNEPAVLLESGRQQQEQGQQPLDAADVNVALQPEEPSSAPADGGVQEEQPQPSTSRPEALLHTNEAPLAAAVLKQLARAAGWSKQQLKQVPPVAARKARASKQPACVGLEVACGSSQAVLRLRAAAEAAGALTCSGAAAEAAAKLFRHLGFDG